MLSLQQYSWETTGLVSVGRIQLLFRLGIGLVTFVRASSSQSRKVRVQADVRTRLFFSRPAVPRRHLDASLSSSASASSSSSSSSSSSLSTPTFERSAGRWDWTTEGGKTQLRCTQTKAEEIKRLKCKYLRWPGYNNSAASLTFTHHQTMQRINTQLSNGKSSKDLESLVIH